MAARSGVMLRFSVAPMVEKLSDADAGAVFKSVFDYAANGTIPDFSERPMADLVWAGLRPLIDRDAEHYSQKCESSA
ncbi:MAG: DUF6291 domain-containing protein [Oscillospiraceae bacterium]|nr:DUF6291 domain-containing protein [Oscillospiraceae bacterium]